jgi:hypothetical protein
MASRGHQRRRQDGPAAAAAHAQRATGEYRPRLGGLGPRCHGNGRRGADGPVPGPRPRAGPGPRSRAGPAPRSRAAPGTAGSGPGYPAGDRKLAGRGKPPPFGIVFFWNGRGSGDAARPAVLVAVTPPGQVTGLAMDLTPVQRRLLFVVVVIVLVGLGVLVVGHRGSGTPAAAPSATPSTGSASAAQAAATTPADTPPSAVPSATPASTAGGAEIYQWLPFTPADLAAAAQTTTAFATVYSTWSYTEDKAAYGAKLSGLVTPTETATLVYDYSTAGVAGPRVTNKQVSTGGGTIDSIRSFAAGPSITFVVTMNQQVTSTQPTSKVSDIELAQLGNVGNQLGSTGNP